MGDGRKEDTKLEISQPSPVVQLQPRFRLSIRDSCADMQIRFTQDSELNITRELQQSTSIHLMFSACAPFPHFINAQRTPTDQSPPPQ